MKISSLFNNDKPVLSFEIFPPKPDFPLDTVFKTLEELKPLDPAFISVTYGAGGSNSARSIEIAAKVKNHHKITTLPHLTCVGASAEKLDDILKRLTALGIENILALRGDPVAGDACFKPTDSAFSYAKDLVRYIKTRPFFSVAAAAYPEGHPECASLDEDILYLKEKVDAGVDFLITQLFFDNSFYYDFREKIERHMIKCPVTIGIMPVFNAAQIKKITALCGAAIPENLLKILDKYSFNPAELEKAGIDFACRQIEDLIVNKADGIHICTMNKSAQTKAIVNNLTGLFR